ncbi:MAG: very short patch repair endonuclease, partial [Beijerinckiaceae bacterium]
MPDIVSPEIRSRMMAGIRSSGTRPEVILRKAIHGAGFRFTLNNKHIYGNPDLVFPKWRAVLFVHGC